MSVFLMDLDSHQTIVGWAKRWHRLPARQGLSCAVPTSRIDASCTVAGGQAHERFRRME